jgi:tetratricopeptide (TPR) repeat protein
MEWLYAKAVPIEAQYLYRKARELSRQGQIAVALNYYKQAVVIAPHYSQAYYEMGNCHARLGQYSEAVKKYQRAIQLDPSSPEPREKMNRLLTMNDRTEKT